MHTFWRRISAWPAQLAVWQKFALLSSLACLPLPFFLYFLFSEHSADRAFNRTELIGVEYARTALGSVYALEFKPDAPAGALTTIIQEESDAVPGARDAFRRCEKLNRAAANSGALRALDAAYDCTEKLTELIADNSNLILDPELDSYYLMDLAILKLPVVYTSLRRLAAGLQFEGADQSARVGAREELGRLRLGIKRSAVRAAGALNDPQSAARVRQAATRLDGVLIDALRLSAEAESSAAQTAAMDRASRAVWQSYLVFSELLAERVRARQERENMNVALSVGLSLLAALIALACSFPVLRSISAPLAATAAGLHGAARGDLVQRLPVQGADEFARLALDFNAFVEELQAAIGAAQTAVQESSRFAANLHDSLITLEESSQEQAAATEEMQASIETFSAGGEQVEAFAITQARALDTLDQSLEAREALQTELMTGLSRAAVSAERVQGLAESGRMMLQGIVETMAGIESSSLRISAIVDIIQEIADRVNLLALNASIEAARAGDAGRGFAVVANEVSRLADRTTESARDINGLVETNAAAIRDGLERARSSAAQIGAIVDGALESSQLVRGLNSMRAAEAASRRTFEQLYAELRRASEAIRQSATEQSGVVREIAHSIDIVTRGTQANATEASAVRSGADRLLTSAQLVRTRLEVFRT